jgi:predicted protein tyrosine phosphatase
MLKNNDSKLDLFEDNHCNNLVSQASHLCDDLPDEELHMEDGLVALKKAKKT